MDNNAAECLARPGGGARYGSGRWSARLAAVVFLQTELWQINPQRWLLSNPAPNRATGRRRN